MDRAIVSDSVVRVLQRVQERQGLPCPALTGASIPATELKKFTSKIWPAATTWIARELGIKIPRKVHIFGTKKGGPLTVDQAVDLICKFGVRRDAPALEPAE
jgi:hypothetical protein